MSNPVEDIKTFAKQVSAINKESFSSIVKCLIRHDPTEEAQVTKDVFKIIMDRCNKIDELTVGENNLEK